MCNFLFSIYVLEFLSCITSFSQFDLNIQIPGFCLTRIRMEDKMLKEYFISSTVDRIYTIGFFVTRRR